MTTGWARGHGGRGRVWAASVGGGGGVVWGTGGWYGDASGAFFLNESYPRSWRTPPSRSAEPNPPAKRIWP